MFSAIVSYTWLSPCFLCYRVLTKSQQNLMSTQGISIVFGPTLMWPEFESGNMEVNMVYQHQIVEFILIECLEIFGPEGKWQENNMVGKK